MDVQRQLAEDPSQFDKLRYQMARLMPQADYTETTERIISSSIETINTVGNVFFTEDVAAFYQMRQLYKTTICDPVLNELEHNEPFTSVKGILGFDYSQYALSSWSILKDMRRQYDRCRQMMKVSDEEIEAFRREREQLDLDTAKEEENIDSIFEIIQLQGRIDDAKAKLK